MAGKSDDEGDDVVDTWLLRRQVVGVAVLDQLVDGGVRYLRPQVDRGEPGDGAGWRYDLSRAVLDGLFP